MANSAEYELDSLYAVANTLTIPNAMRLIRDWYVKNTMYVGMMGQFLDPALLKDVPDTRVKLRVERNFQSFGHTSSPDRQDLNPHYEFEIANGGSARNVSSVGKSALDMIRVVPNPYISVSEYENSQIDNRVKIINLPSKCVVSIFNLSGTMVRQYNFDQSSTLPYASNANGENQYNSRGTNYQTFLDWDLKNQAGIPIASGVYIIHINSPQFGEKVIKWFGVLRPIDLDTFN